jgi:hypothetical protein
MTESFARSYSAAAWYQGGRGVESKKVEERGCMYEAALFG